MRRTGRTLAVLFVLSAWAALATPVFAHATVVASFPADGSVQARPPTTVHIWFSEPVQPVGPGMIVISPSGRRLSLGPLHADGNELWATLTIHAAGTYLVIWQAISLDTHPERGRFTFSLEHAGVVPGAPGFGPVSATGLALQTLGRWLHLLGFALAFGPIAFRLLVLAPLALGGTPARRALWRLTSAGILLLVLAEPIVLLGQTASLGNGIWDSYLAGEALSSSFGRVFAQRLGAAAALWMLIGVARAGAGRAEWLMLVLACALALADGQASHAVSSGPLFIGLLANAGHEIGMAGWIGGLAAMLAVWNLPDVAPCRGQAFRAFGELALLYLVVIGLTGALMAAAHLDSPHALLSTGYGRALALKTLLLGVVLALAWRGSRPRQARRERVWRTEIVVMCVLLVFAALMVSLPPPA